MARIFAEAPNAFAVGRIAHLAKHGAHFSRIQPGDDRQGIFDWLWAMGWVSQGFELNSLTWLRALTAEILKAQCRRA
ncbi:hypothetical protein [Paraburkholderia sp. WC7.3d]|uniref:hypothetical protein n=1 Tax=Paraburkholderia sp. WC7.3d TaxID=2991069 RepID=UPI003D243D01